LAQAVELVRDVEVARATVRRLLAGGLDAERAVPCVPRAGGGIAVIEALRGLLVHRYGFDAEGLVTAAEVITPTALNAASIEERFAQLVVAEGGAADQPLRRRLEMVARA